MIDVLKKWFFVIMFIIIYFTILGFDLNHLQFQKNKLKAINKNLVTYKMSLNDDKNLKTYEENADIGMKKIETTLGSEVTNEDEIRNEISKLKTDIETKKTKVTELTTTESTVKKTLDSTYSTYIKAKSDYEYRLYNHYINGVPTINQYPSYPNGCEMIALLILLKYHQVNVSANDLAISINKGDFPYYEGETWYGGNPNAEYIGDPRIGSSSYGTYNKTIENLANIYKGGINNATGTNLSDILKIVKQNKPVLVWTTLNLRSPSLLKSWIYKPDGSTKSWYYNEHAVVIIGYTKDKIIISDPYNGTVKYQSKASFEYGYNFFGKQALYY